MEQGRRGRPPRPGIDAPAPCPERGMPLCGAHTQPLERPSRDQVGSRWTSRSARRQPHGGCPSPRPARRPTCLSPCPNRCALSRGPANGATVRQRAGGDLVPRGANGKEEPMAFWSPGVAPPRRPATSRSPSPISGAISRAVTRCARPRRSSWTRRPVMASSICTGIGHTTSPLR